MARDWMFGREIQVQQWVHDFAGWKVTRHASNRLERAVKERAKPDVTRQKARITDLGCKSAP